MRCHKELLISLQGAGWKGRFPLHDTAVPWPRFAFGGFDSVQPPPTNRLPLFSAHTIKGKCCWFLSCGVSPPPPSAQPPTSSTRNDCREVHLITSKLHLHFIPISHLPSSSLFYSNFSIHHLFFFLQSSLLFLIYTVFSSQEFCSRRAHAA